MSKRLIIPDLLADPVEVALRQAKRERKKGKHRKAMLLLRRAAFEAHQRPGLWTRYALSCMKGGNPDDGRKAFAHAAWLHERQGHKKTAELTRRLAQQAEDGRLPRLYA